MLILDNFENLACRVVIISTLRLIWCLAALCLLVSGSDTPSRTGPINSDLTGLWPLIRATGGRDVSPYGRDAKLQQNATYENGDCGVFQFREPGGNVIIDRLAEKRGRNGAFTIAMWIKLHKLGDRIHEHILSWRLKSRRIVFAIIYNAKRLYVLHSRANDIDIVTQFIFVSSKLKVGRWIKIAVIYQGENHLCFYIDKYSDCVFHGNFRKYFNVGFDANIVIGTFYQAGKSAYLFAPHPYGYLGRPMFDLFCLQVWRTTQKLVSSSFASVSDPCRQWNPNICKLKPNQSSTDHALFLTVGPSSSSITNITEDRVRCSTVIHRKASHSALAYVFTGAAVFLVGVVAGALCVILFRRLRNPGVSDWQHFRLT